MKFSHRFPSLFAMITAFTLWAAGPAQAASQTRVTWFGHAAFAISTPTGKTLVIDPWITNPANPNGKAQLASLTKVDLILITHGHMDHVGDSADIAKRTGAKLVALPDLGNTLVAHGGFPKEQSSMETEGVFGGELTLLDGEVTVTFVPAVHSSDFTLPSSGETYPGGEPAGFLISIKNGPVIYHTGDTDVFSDMSMIPRDRQIDLMLTCIGGHFTMGPRRAAEAVRLVKPKMAVPMHFGTFPLLTGTPAAFEQAVKKTGAKTKVRTMKIGETLTL